MRIDPYKHKERFLRWKEKTKDFIPGITPENSEIIKKYLGDMEHGINVASGNVKGPRSHIRLNSLKTRLIFFAHKFKEVYKINKITDISEEQVCRFFSEMKSGSIKRRDGKNYTAVSHYVKIFKHFGIGTKKLVRKKAWKYWI